MKKYVSHKVVEAAMIKSFHIVNNTDEDGGNSTPRGWRLWLKGEEDAIIVPPEFFARGGPDSGDSDLGYLVQYADGYQSWTPAEPFEDGYTLMDVVEEDSQYAPHEQRVVDERNELADNLAKLTAFFHTVIFEGLQEVDQGLLVTQEDQMTAYLVTLNSRIKRFA